MKLDVLAIQELIPHRYPLLLVDTVTSYEAKKTITAYKNISITDAVFQGHFPKEPIYPGVFIIEGLAQSAGLLMKLSVDEARREAVKDKICYFVGIDKAKFKSPVRPGDCLVYKVNYIKDKRNLFAFEAKALVDDKLVASADIKIMLEN